MIGHWFFYDAMVNKSQYKCYRQIKPEEPAPGMTVYAIIDHPQKIFEVRRYTSRYQAGERDPSLFKKIERQNDRWVRKREGHQLY